jgi:predicted amino acid racemase
MAFINLNRTKLKENYSFLNDHFKREHVDWAIVTKLLCGHEPYLEEVINLGIKEVCDSRISNLQKVKEIDPNVETVYIKPPAKLSIKEIVQYADASFNTEFYTIKLLSDEAQKQGKTHKVIIMIELGDLREGIMGEHLLDFYGSIFKLPNIKVSGIGANLNCLNGVMPSEDKLIQLSLYKQLIEAKFNCEIPWVTGGTSVVVPLLLNHQVPEGVNHFRIGEMLYFGNNLVSGENMTGMNSDVFELYTEVIEITEKPKVPIGLLDKNPSGEMAEINKDDYGKKSYRAILDLGLLDINPDYLIPEDKSLEISGASSDMLIIDLGDDAQEYKVGDLIPFKMKYMGTLSLMNSFYIEKRVID